MHLNELALLLSDVMNQMMNSSGSGSGSGNMQQMIEQMQQTGEEYPQIWHLFAFRPQATEHLARFTQEIMRGPAPISPGLRELIAAFTSDRNDCPF